LYIIKMSDSSSIVLYTSHPIQQIDYFLVFEGKVETDSTFETNWWYKINELERINFPIKH
jgi:hypothetical protein